MHPDCDVATTTATSWVTAGYFVTDLHTMYRRPSQHEIRRACYYLRYKMHPFVRIGRGKIRNRTMPVPGNLSTVPLAGELSR